MAAWGWKDLQKALPQKSTLAKEQWLCLGIAAAIGMLLWLVGLSLWGGVWLPGHFGVFLVTYALVVAAGSLPDRWISSRLDAVLDRWVRDKSGGGLYGMIALSVFFGKEVRALFGNEGIFSGAEFVRGQIIQYFIGFSVDSIKNMIEAFIWPWSMFSEFGLIQSAVFVLACWAVFTVSRRYLPQPNYTAIPKSKKASNAPSEEGGNS